DRPLAALADRLDQVAAQALGGEAAVLALEELADAAGILLEQLAELVILRPDAQFVAFQIVDGAGEFDAVALGEGVAGLQEGIVAGGGDSCQRQQRQGNTAQQPTASEAEFHAVRLAHGASLPAAETAAPPPGKTGRRESAMSHVHHSARGARRTVHGVWAYTVRVIVPGPPMPSRILFPALKVALAYLVFAGMWIALSDRLVDSLVDDHASYVLIQTWKGWFFVVVTAGLLFLLVRAAMARLRKQLLTQQRLVSELVTSRSTQAQLLDVLEDAVWMREIGGPYLFLSPAIERIYGVKTEVFTEDGDYWLHCVHPEDRASVAGKAALLEEEGWAELEYRIVHPDGKTHWVRDRTRLLRDADGRACRLIGIVSDISLQRQHTERIHRLSNYDSLTGLPNRR